MHTTGRPLSSEGPRYRTRPSGLPSALVVGVRTGGVDSLMADALQRGRRMRRFGSERVARLGLCPAARGAARIADRWGRDVERGREELHDPVRDWAGLLAAGQG